MAAECSQSTEVPAGDVLCEAMEYLSKLGSNLRSRSESLKEKRISKGKLKNSHALHKAANKVLLICELSKKSLDNVETGVRKVLSLLDAAQLSDAKNRQNKEYHYFEYKSRQLRIAKKIPLKHYMSVKVVARGMPTTMIDKYPVYYNCKLKRHRRRAAEIQNVEHNTDNLSDEDVDKNKTGLDSVNEQLDINDLGTEDINDENMSESKNDAVNEIEQMDKNLDSTSKINDAKPSHIQKDKSDCDHDSPSNSNKKTSNSDEGDSKKKECNNTSKRSSKEDKSNDKKHQRVRFATVHSSDDESQKSKHLSETDTKKCSNDDDDKNNSQNDSLNNEPKVKKIKLEPGNDTKTKEDSEKAVKSDSENDSIISNNNQSQNGSSSESTRPMIRCVNLSTLLKPNIKIVKSPTKLHEKNTKSDNDNRAQRRKKKYEEYCSQKKKEVSEFKPKKFSVKIERLPSLSVRFLLAHNLKKIIKAGDVICEIPNEIDTPILKKKIKAVKNALLNDSESDDNIEMSKTEKVKKALLTDSDSEHSSSKKECDKESSQSDNIQQQTNKIGSDSKKNEEHVATNIAGTDSENSDTQVEATHKTKTKDTNSEEQVETANGQSDAEKNEKQVDNTEQQKNKTDTGSETNDQQISEVNDEQVDTENNVSETANDEAELPTEVSKQYNDELQNESKSSSDNDESNSQSKKDNSDNHSDMNEPETPTKSNRRVKSSLLKDSSDSNSEITPRKIKKPESSLLNHSPKDDIAGCDHNNQETPTKTIQKIKSSLLNNSSDERSDKNNDKESPTKTIQKVKSSLLNNSSDEKSDKIHNKESPATVNQKVKSSLLNNSSDENSDKNKEMDTPTKTNEQIKSALLNESSDIKSDVSEDREKRKTPKNKRKHARRSREAKKKLKYSSNSDSEPEKNRRKKKDKRKAHMSSSSSSGEEKIKKKFGQIDGTVDEHSNSSFDKMVRSKAKPSGSSSLNSDTQDASDKDIDGLTNLNNLSKNRRRDRREDRKHTRSHAKPILGEELLKAESSSGESDDDNAGNDGEIDEDLPPVTLPGINGDGIEHMAKDDLLESDSSVSQKDNSNAEDESDDDGNVISKRRKANAISSDEEYGSKLKKKMSDFEDSDDDNSESTKKSKRKKKLTDSDGSLDSTDEGKKKRRRIKPVNDSDISGSDSENDGKNKHGRKNIRKVMGKNQLEEATKKAAREEKERIARIAERQKVYNNLAFDESGKPDEVVLEKVVLDFDPETKEPLIQVDRGLVKKLKPHQANGIKFMWDACFESVKRIKKDKGSGCILAHCMGLGKTLQVISLTHTLLTHNSLTGVNRVLVVCPLSTVLNWVNEVRMWLKHADSDFDVDVYELSRYKQNSERAFQLQQWIEGGGVCVLGYEMFRNLSADNNKKFKKKMLKSFQEALVDPGPDLVVCDEGHLLKNEKTSLSQSMNKVKTLRRIVLTGTPLQNNLKEYYCMVQFVKPNLLGKYNEYLNRFVNPITNGQYTDSTEHDIKVMKRRSHVLHKMLDGAVQRRDYGVLAPFLPPKHEYVLFITLTDVQVKLYQHYLDNYSRRPLAGKSSGFLFPDFQSLQRIWTHPLVLKYNSERYEIMQQKKRDKEEEDSEGSLVDFIDDDSTPDESSTEESSDDLSDVSDDSRKKSSKKKKASKKSKAKEAKASTRRGTRANPGAELDDDMPEEIEMKNENPTEWWIKLVEETELDDLRNSHKLVLLFDILRQCDAIGDKLLVFSQSLYSLDLIEHFLGKVDEATQDGRIDEKLGGHVGSWSPGVDYFRLDGSTSCENRSIWCKNFNREDNPRARLFLISTRAGGLGINLVAANRVVIFDVSWNPSHDVQSIFRVYRFGQKKPCYVYRFLAMGTMEEKIYERQVTKQAISKRVIDEQQIDRHYAENDLAELYKFEARPSEARALPTLPKDRLFAEMLKEHEAQIFKYHEHDSLLENKEEETLSEEERKAAWEDFENEKNKPPPAPFPSWNMQNGMMPGLLAAQQQQLAYAALAAMLRKDMPNINDNQIRDMLPLIYNSNPQMFGGYDYGLMQKMSEIYKYAQPGMMNPGMMNPMNAGSGGGANMGGTSGLQYEPPWQRQQQQQQQMRLQQLMQQQNQMGAKFYSGGLGSRDPVAMALQQQRAREIMMGGGAGRPRGRPPLQPRATSATTSDVVNLDSD